MTWIADAHREWHTVHGTFAVCPLDCGAGETYDPADYLTPAEYAAAVAEAEEGRAPAVPTSSWADDDPWTDPATVVRGDAAALPPWIDPADPTC